MPHCHKQIRNETTPTNTLNMDWLLEEGIQANNVNMIKDKDTSIILSVACKIIYTK